VSVKFPAELNAEMERFVEETGLYTNRSEFVRAACREHLERLHEDPAVAALRLGQILGRAERSRLSDEGLGDRLNELRETVDADAFADALDEAREGTAETVQE
jgi:Arc/MetJ-type ribon-helix-helix transcriptional regulator